MNFWYLLLIAMGIYSGLTMMRQWDREESRAIPLDDRIREGKDTRTISNLGRNNWYEKGSLALLIVMLVALMGPEMLLQVIFDLVPTVTVYLGVLLLFLPLLRKYIRPRACGVLWIFPLIICSLAVVFFYWVNAPIPLLLIYMPSHLWWGLTALWLTGSILLLLWYELGHLRFTRQLKQNFTEADDGLVELLRQECDRVGWNRPLPLRISPEIQSPLTVGIRARDLAVYLPQRSYTPEEYVLIFRHELRHMLRRDNQTKRQWAVLRSLFWFHPLVWLASRRAAEDIELSCDEFVLKEAGPATRQRYAELLLNTAGDSRGYSTCLSARASTLRYRLKCVVAPTKQFSGSIILALAILFLLLAFPQVSFVTQRGELGSFFHLADMEAHFVQYSVKSRSPFKVYEGQKEGKSRKEGQPPEATLHDTAAVMAYLESLSVTRLPQRMLTRGAPDCMGHNITMRLASETQSLQIKLSKDYLYLQPQEGKAVLYRVDEPLDWSWLRGNLNLEHSETADAVPEMYYWFDPADAADPLRASGRQINVPEDSALPPWLNIGGYKGLDLEQFGQVKLAFSYPPQQYTVIVADDKGITKGGRTTCSSPSFSSPGIKKEKLVFRRAFGADEGT